MNITVPISNDDRPTLSDVIMRLGVLYPGLTITCETQKIIIADADPSLADSIRQTALDQIIRSKFDAGTASLRENLYKKLLG